LSVVPADYYYPICESTFIIFCNLGFEKLLACSDGSGSKIFDPTSGQPSMVWVWIWKISPKNVKFFNFFPFRSKSTRVKGGSASYLLRVKNKLRSGQVKAHLYRHGRGYYSSQLGAFNLLATVIPEKIITNDKILEC